MSKSEISIIGKERESNIELLRLVSMFMILCLHANYLAFGAPTKADFDLNFYSASGRVLLEQICIVAVNVFILISGWFGIRPKRQGLLSLLFQVLFYSAIITIGNAVVNGSFGKSDFLDIAIIGRQYWFIASYLLLYLLAPMINAFVEKTSKASLEKTIVYFFIVETFFGFITQTNGFNSGYSTISFIGLYMLARYLSLNECKLMDLRQNRALLFFVICSLILAGSYIVSVYFATEAFLLHMKDYCISYINPLVILSSVMLFLFFCKLKLKSKLVNWMSSSALAIYLIHTNPHILHNVFCSMVRQVFADANSTLMGVACILLFIICVFVFCIVTDKVRIFVQKKLLETVLSKIERHSL